jgi:hypothetical protein
MRHVGVSHNDATTRERQPAFPLGARTNRTLNVDFTLPLASSPYRCESDLVGQRDQQHRTTVNQPNEL